MTAAVSGLPSLSGAATTAARRLAALGLLFALVACGGGGGGADAGAPPPPAPPAPPNPAPQPPPPSVQGGPQGLHWSWTEELVPYTGADGFTYFHLQFRYKFLKFFNNGLVHVGEPDADIGTLQCTQRSLDSDGDLKCAPYEIGTNTIRIEGEDWKSLVQDGNNWRIDDKTYTPLAPVSDLRLAGRYASISCYLALCTRASFEFRADGSFEADRSNTYANTLGNLFVSAGSAGSDHGTYRIDGHGITLTLANGRSATLFFFRDGETIMIAEDWYDPST